MLEGIDWAIVLWLLAGVLSGVGELLTGGLFLLPFAVGAFAAAAAAAFGAGVPIVLVVFSLSSLVTLVWAIRYGRRMRSVPPATHEGANRYVDALGVVTKTVAGRDAGQVRVGTESWRALSAAGSTLEEGAAIRVVEVRGNALVVVPEGDQVS